MKQRQAIHILMLSPCYWLLDLPARKELIREFCASFESCEHECESIVQQTAPERVDPY